MRALVLHEEERKVFLVPTETHLYRQALTILQIRFKAGWYLPPQPLPNKGIGYFYEPALCRALSDYHHKLYTDEKACFGRIVGALNRSEGEEAWEALLERRRLARTYGGERKREDFDLSPLSESYALPDRSEAVYADLVANWA